LPATRLLVIADPKLLPTLAAGLREAGRFDVAAISTKDLEGAAAAIAQAEALAFFYGAPDRPLSAALQALAAPLRERGGRVIGVLQRDQASQRDDCFRAGASELLYMPMPKEQFVARLQSAVALTYGSSPGVEAAVSFATRTATVELPAQVTADGVHGDGELSFRAGETVRISFPGFQAWGLVVRAGPGAQVRFAGLWPEDEKQLRDWLEGRLEAKTRADLPLALRAAPTAGPPPGFADRRPVRPISASPLRTPQRGVRPVAPAPLEPKSAAPAEPSAVPAAAAIPPAPDAAAVPPASAAAAVPPAPAAAAVPPAPAAAAPERLADPVSPAAPGESVASAESAESAEPIAPAEPLPAAATQSAALAGIFDEGEGAPSPREGKPAAAEGPPWPRPADPAICRSAAVMLLADREAVLPAQLSPELTAAVRKVVGTLASTERAALDRLGPDSALADALTARIALEAARSEGIRLYSSTPPAVVDQAGFGVLVQFAEAASSRLQKDADLAIVKGEVEQLQLVTGGSAALSRDLLAFKETADRLRGKGAAPRLGGGALDPHLDLRGPLSRPAAARNGASSEPVRAELRDFEALDDTQPKQGLKRALLIASLLFVLAVANLLFFAGPHIKELPLDAAGQGVKRILLSEGAAVVTVDQQFVDHFVAEEPHLLEVLRSRGAVKAALELDSGGSAGFIDVATGKVSGVPVAKPAEEKTSAAPAARK